MTTPSERRVFGSTGEIGRDGFLTPDHYMMLNRIQENAANVVFDYFANMEPGEPFLMVAMATGIGKGNIIHRVIERQIKQKPESKVLVIAGTKLVLVKQTHDALAQYQQTTDNGFNYIESEDDEELVDETTSIEENLLDAQQSFLYKTGKVGQSDVNVHVATIQTVQSAIGKDIINPDEYDLVIVDEVHNIGTQKRKETVEKFKNVVGFTATPYRYSGKMKAPEQYGFKVVESLTLPEAQELRLLPPLVGMQIDTKEVVDEIPTSKNGQIDFKALEGLLKESPDLRPLIADRVANIISSEGRNYKTVMAVNFVWEAQELAKLLHEKGIKVGIAVNQQAAKQIHSNEIPAIGSIDRYKLPENDEDSLQVLISPYVASEGFDAPFTEVLVWASPTDSPLRYTQYTGRLARRAEGKLFGVVVDCLYQTNQYNWAYNMGMWMKGNVRQLDNGMLWLGPETDIEKLKNLPQLEALRKQADFKDLDDLQKEGLLELQEGDFPITQNSLEVIFEGTKYKLYLDAKTIAHELADEYPGFVATRRNKARTILVVTDKELLIRMMVVKGTKLRRQDTEGIQEGDIMVTERSLAELFIGSANALAKIGKDVFNKLIQLDPSLAVVRKSGKHHVPVVRDRDLFIKYMLKRGVQLREDYLETVQPGEIAISGPSLRNIFIGAPDSLLAAANIVCERFAESNPSIVVQKKLRNHILKVVTDRELFISEMENLGVKKRMKDIMDVQETDIILSNKLKTVFKGEFNKLRTYADQVIAELTQENPSIVATRRNGPVMVNVVTDRERFIEEMLKRGIKLKKRNNKSII